MAEVQSVSAIQESLASIDINASGDRFDTGVLEMLNMMRELLTPEDKTPITQYSPEVAANLQAGIDKFLHKDTYLKARHIIDGQYDKVPGVDMLGKFAISGFYKLNANLPADQAFNKFMNTVTAPTSPESYQEFLKNPKNVREHMPQSLKILENSKALFAGLNEVYKPAPPPVAVAKKEEPAPVVAGGGILVSAVPFNTASGARTNAPAIDSTINVAPAGSPEKPESVVSTASTTTANSSSRIGATASEPVTPPPVEPVVNGEPVTAAVHKPMTIETIEQAQKYVEESLAKFNSSINEQIEEMKKPTVNPKTGETESKLPFFVKVKSLEEPKVDGVWDENDKRAVQDFLQFARSSRGMNIPSDSNNPHDDTRLYSEEVGVKIQRAIPAFLSGLTPEQKKKFEAGFPDKGDTLIQCLNMLNQNDDLSKVPTVEKGPIQVAGWMQGLLGRLAPLVVTLLGAVGIEDAGGLVDSFMSDNLGLKLADLSSGSGTKSKHGTTPAQPKAETPKTIIAAKTTAETPKVTTDAATATASSLADKPVVKLSSTFDTVTAPKTETGNGGNVEKHQAFRDNHDDMVHETHVPVPSEAAPGLKLSQPGVNG